MNLSGKLRFKHVKTQIWWPICFPLIDRCLEGISYFQTVEWLMIDELFHNVSHVSWGFFDLDFRWFFWRWNWEVTKSEKTAPGSQSLTKAYRPVMASVKKMVPKMGKSKVSWKIPPNEGFKGKIKLNGGFSRPSLPKGQSFFFGSSQNMGFGGQEIHSHVA